MKKVLIVLISFILPIVVFGLTCDSIIDTQTSNDRSIVCDLEKSTSTTYKTNSDVEVLKNDVCSIKCSENIVFSIDPIKKVLAGTSFSYPLYVSGERKCTATYNYANYEARIKTLVSEYASLTGSAKETKKNEIVNYYSDKKECDNFTKKGTEEFAQYLHKGDVSLKIGTSTSDVNLTYKFVPISKYEEDQVVDTKEVTYTSCNFDEATIKCLNSNKTIEGWDETVRVFGKYTMPDTYLEKYTGKVCTTSNANTCNAKDRYFVSLSEISKPAKGDPTDKGYKLTLEAKNLGDNLLDKNRKNWNLNVDCWYQVKNLIYPQKDSLGRCLDENCEKYGTNAFQYRIIELNDPFPGRTPGANWTEKNVQDVIYSTKDKLSTLQRFVITLDRSSINKIREYNDAHPYDTFNLDEMEKSKFIEANPNIIVRSN